MDFFRHHKNDIVSDVNEYIITLEYICYQIEI